MAGNSLETQKPVLESLRTGTRALHERIETNPLHSAIVNGTVTRESYCRLLEKMYGFHKSFETHAGSRAEWSEFGFDFESRSKLAAIQSDLAAMNWNGETGSIPTLPLPLEHSEFAFVAGYLYVSEGSTLGGQVLMKSLTPKLHVSREEGGRYFSSYGERVGEKWKECRDFLTRVGGVSEQSTAEMVAGASDAFFRLDAWLRV